MNTSNIKKYGKISCIHGKSCPWILTDQWELIFNPYQKSVCLDLYKLHQFFENPYWKDHVQSVSFIKGINLIDDIDFSLNSLFSGFTALKSVDLSQLDFYEFTRMDYMFYGCTALESVKFTSCDFGKHIDTIDYMFFNCTHLHTLDLSHFAPELLSSMKSAFSNCQQLTKLNLSKIRFSNYDSISMECCFYNCVQLSECQLPCSDIFNYLNLNHCFYSCKNLHSVDLSVLNFNAINRSALITLFCFDQCTNLESVQYPTIKYSDPADVKLHVSHAFSNCPNLQSFQWNFMIPYTSLKAMGLSASAIQHYICQLNEEEVKIYIEKDRSDPCDKAELMELLHTRKRF